MKMERLQPGQQTEKRPVGDFSLGNERARNHLGEHGDVEPRRVVGDEQRRRRGGAPAPNLDVKPEQAANAAVVQQRHAHGERPVERQTRQLRRQQDQRPSGDRGDCRKGTREPHRKLPARPTPLACPMPSARATGHPNRGAKHLTRRGGHLRPERGRKARADAPPTGSPSGGPRGAAALRCRRPETRSPCRCRDR